MVERAEPLPAPPDADASLLALLRQGDDSAFTRLFERHYETVFRAAYALTRSREEAEDAAQESFLALFRAPPRPVPGASLAPWLCRVALNRAANSLRGARRAQARAARVGRMAEEPSTPGPEESLERAAERERVRAALAQLPARQARILALRSAGLSYAEVAETLDLAPGSIGTLLTRAERAFLHAYDRSSD
jgi:RNA polymerase sigma-70 factor (ECF subfamily)